MSYLLTANEKERLKDGIRAAFAIPFIDDVEDFIWEAIFSYAKNIPLSDPLTTIRKKLLFDIVDTKSSIGWSAKTILWQIRPRCEFEVVIQRADILKKSRKLGFGLLTKDSPPDILGQALLTHWYHKKVLADSITQNVKEMRVCILLKSKNRKQYAFIEEKLKQYHPEELEWKWTDEQKNGLQGIRKNDGFRVFRWYPNQTHFFERFVMPQHTEIFNLNPKRLPVGEVIEMLMSRI